MATNDPYGPLGLQVGRLHALVNSLRHHHNSLREQNDRVVRTGLSMENKLKPVEHGLRLEAERRAAKDAALRTGFGLKGGEGEEEEPVSAEG